MALRSVILLPPSEGKALGGRGAPWAPGRSAFPELDDARAAVLAALAVEQPAAAGPTMPALRRYTGVLYKELDAASIEGAARRRLNRNVLVVSGAWGLVAPTDPVPYYKLKMSARLPSVGALTAWWRPKITAALAPRVAGAVVWDLLPGEHAAAVDWRRLAPRRRITVQFLDASGKTVSHWNKLLKGSLVRWLAETGATDVADLAGFHHPQGYRYDESATVDEGVLVRVVFREVRTET